MDRIRRNRLVTRTLFGAASPGSGDQALWDYTSLVFRKAIRRYCKHGMRIWELGCGPIAVLSQYALAHSRVESWASDWDQACVERARAAGGQGRQSIRVVLADLADGVPGKFDLVFFNAPYLPLADESRLPPLRPRTGPESSTFLRRLGGGDDGLATIVRFLRDPATRTHLRPGSKILLGFNRFYVPEERVAHEARRAGFQVHDRTGVWWNPSLVLVLGVEP